MIDVIIPVYRGLEATRRCIESVLAAGCDGAHTVIVIDDASPEEGMSPWLARLAASNSIELLTHARNRGFVASVNEAMALHPERDVVLLNSDTEVPPRWLDRLVACAAREPRAGSVTPFSNNATICSYPRFAEVNGMPGNLDVARLDALFASENAGHSIEIPTAVGFCMYITRKALDAAGSFDEDAFGRGYGEEVDFCMRASRLGWRHLLCADLFVYHQGEVSFGAGGEGLRLRAQAIVDQRYPEFQALLAEFIAREPARPWRRRVDLARLANSPRPRVLFVTHAWGGGVARHVDDLAHLLADDCEVLVLRPADENTVELRWQREGEEFAAWFESSTQWDELLEMLRGVGVSRVHFHHVHGLPRQVLELGASLDAPFDVTVHDHYPICSQYHLSPDGRHPCEAAGSGDCMRCVESRPSQWQLDVAQWRGLFHGFLAGAARVIAPSADTAARIGRFFPDVVPLMWPHPETVRPSPALFKVALLGGVSPIKGAEAFEACVGDARARGLPLHFHVIGHIGRPIDTWPAAPVSVGGSYPEAKLQELIALERPDAFLFLSQVPETYSYTLSAAMQTGLPIVATRAGAFPERLHGYRRHLLVALDAPAAAINDALLATLAARPAQAADR